MITKFIHRFDAKREEILAQFKEKHPVDYKEIVKTVVLAIRSDEDGYDLDPDRIHQIDDGEYQGTYVFVIGQEGYQPSRYWYVKVSYGSCSGCDTFLDIKDYADDDDIPTEKQAIEYFTLALHILQNMREMYEGDD